MNKGELITYVAQEAGFKKSEAEKALNAVFKGIIKAVKKGETASFVGFGSFSSIERKARTGRNPRTGETIKIAASRSAKFRPGILFKESKA